MQEGLITRKLGTRTKQKLWNRKLVQSPERALNPLPFYQVQGNVGSVSDDYFGPQKDSSKGYTYAQLRDRETLTTDTEPVSEITETHIQTRIPDRRPRSTINIVSLQMKPEIVGRAGSGQEEGREWDTCPIQAANLHSSLSLTPSSKQSIPSY